MLELLHRWAKLEPERANNRTVFLGGYWQHNLFLRGIDQVREYAIIQAAVQEAVTAHGWHLELTLFRDGSSGAFIYETENLQRPLNQATNQDSAAANLLDAYVQALEACLPALEGQ